MAARPARAVLPELSRPLGRLHELPSRQAGNQSRPQVSRRKDAAKKLLAEADVFVENMSYGAVQRLGLSYDKCPVSTRASSTGTHRAGETPGLMSNKRCADTAVQAFAGVAATNGKRGGEPDLIRWYAPLRLQAPSSYIVFLSLLGLLNRFGPARACTCSDHRSARPSPSKRRRSPSFLATGKPVPRMGSATTTTVPHRAYQCKDGRWLAVGVVEEAQWRRLCQAIGSVDLSGNADLATNRGRVKNRDLVDGELSRIFQTSPAYWWELQLRKAWVPVSRFLEGSEVIDHHAGAREQAVHRAELPEEGCYG